MIPLRFTCKSLNLNSNLLTNKSIDEILKKV